MVLIIKEVLNAGVAVIKRSDECGKRGHVNSRDCVRGEPYSNAHEIEPNIKYRYCCDCGAFYEVN